jgi:hypothetical protein
MRETIGKAGEDVGLQIIALACRRDLTQKLCTYDVYTGFLSERRGKHGHGPVQV